MAFWHRIGKSKSKLACTQLRACYIQLPNASSLNCTPKPRPLERSHPYWLFHHRPPSVSHSVKLFAAPVQFQKKWKEDEDDGTSGPRLNEEIKSRYVRLVRDDGHSIVSRFEALERARKLKLDLVEVQRNANPPVCKIMDFHKETYKRQEIEKERAKAKSEVTLRKGECKEMRVSEKTESKDLKMKADMVKKLMDKGYRVKCKATGNENQDLIGTLSRLLALIEDVTVVESGPSMGRKEAFMIVRHIKYGPSKKGSSAGKKSQDAAHMAVKGQDDNMEPANSVEYENQNSVKSGEVLSDGDRHIPFSDKNIDDRNNGGFVFSKNVNGTTSPDHQTYAAPNDAEPENRYKRADHRNAESENRYGRADRLSAENAVTENRYRRAEPRNRFQQTTYNNTEAGELLPSNLNRTRHAPVDTNVNPAEPRNRCQQRTYNNTDAGRSMPLNLNRTRHVPVDTNVNPKIENTKQGATPASRNPMPSHDPSRPRSGYGIFSAQKGPETQQGVQPGMHRNREGQPSRRESR